MPKILAKAEWEPGRFRHNGAQFSKRANGEYAVHWINKAGDTVCGFYCAKQYRQEAAEEYIRRVEEAMQVGQFAPEVAK